MPTVEWQASGNDGSDTPRSLLQIKAYKVRNFLVILLGENSFYMLFHKMICFLFFKLSFVFESLTKFGNAPLELVAYHKYTGDISPRNQTESDSLNPTSASVVSLTNYPSGLYHETKLPLARSRSQEPPFTALSTPLPSSRTSEIRESERDHATVSYSSECDKSTAFAP